MAKKRDLSGLQSHLGDSESRIAVQNERFNDVLEKALVNQSTSYQGIVLF